MAISIVPTDWLAGLTNGTNTVVFNTDDNAGTKTLPQLTTVKSNVTTGDIRQIKFSIDDVLYQHYLSLASADKPIQMRLTRSVSGDSSGNLTFVYSSQYVVSPGGIYTIPAEV